jgi:hypothetical protein
VPKASRKEKEAGLQEIVDQIAKEDGRLKDNGLSSKLSSEPRKNPHPTMKPLALMSYLITMGIPLCWMRLIGMVSSRTLKKGRQQISSSNGMAHCIFRLIGLRIVSALGMTHCILDRLDAVARCGYLSERMPHLVL